MKISIAASILILLVAALFGIPQHQRLAAIRESHAKLTAAAAQLGIFLNPSQPHHPVLITKRERENKAAEAKLAAAEWIAYTKEINEMGAKGASLDGAQQKRALEIRERMISLNPSQIKIFIAELKATKDLNDKTRRHSIGMALISLSNDHPQAALELFTESLDLFETGWYGKILAKSSLATWAKDDPLGALEWVKKSSAKSPDFITDDIKQGLISGAASKDPKLAFQLIDELDMKKTSSAFSSIIYAATTPQQRTLTLNALREYLAKFPPEKAEELSSRSFSQFAHQVANDGFLAGTQWVAESNLTPAELDSFSRSLP